MWWFYTHDGSMVLLYMVCHGSHQYTPFMLAYIPAPWTLWDRSGCVLIVHFYHLRHVSKIWPETESWKGQWFVNYITWILTGMNLQKFPSDFHRFPGPRDHRQRSKASIFLAADKLQRPGNISIERCQVGGGNLGERANKKQRTRQKRGNHKKKHRTTEQLMMTGISALEFTFRSWFFCIFMLKYRGSIMNESEHIWRKNTHLRWNYLPANRTSKQGIFQPRWELFFGEKTEKTWNDLQFWPADQGHVSCLFISAVEDSTTQSATLVECVLHTLWGTSGGYGTRFWWCSRWFLNWFAKAARMWCF